ncbi:MAG TPA: hypothetical protein PK210_00435 [Bacteroidia bacterium]|jgi:hypothetical protein|nr:hypothetical protein [Bacteroidia bacterium]HQO87672.1 hypothetical protein [Bacteroidia bacterium]HRF15131.1 hypothetical protein [Bacteroidia bacterium]HRH82674.1 hypothetical protein [Bacteroidia bacterium]HRR24853.1 hypothetical protein [Bacteroidia bacterium]
MYTNQYKAGCCNIGEAEIRIRQKFLIFFLLISILLTITVHFYHSLWVFYLLFLTTLATIILFVEVVSRFCVLFAIFSLHNFHEPGNLDAIDDRHCKKKDRLRALYIIMGAIVVALLYTWLISVFC